MGWTYPYAMELRSSMVADRIREKSGEWRGARAVWVCKRHCYRGNRFRGVLWTVQHIVNVETAEVLAKFIGCDLLEYVRSSEYGNGWGYKDMCESSGPCYYSCPLSYLDEVPVADSPYAGGWRKAVRAYHAKRNKKLTVGETYNAAPSLKVGSRRVLRIKVTSLRPLRGDAYLEGGEGECPERVKFSKKHVLSLEEAAERDAEVDADRKKVGVTD